MGATMATSWWIDREEIASWLTVVLGGIFASFPGRVDRAPIRSVGLFLRLALRALLDAQELVRPEPLEHPGPVVDGFQPFAVDAVEALPAIASSGHEAHLLQHAQMLGDHRLGPTEPADEVVHGHLPVRQRLQHLPPFGLGDGIERVERGGCTGHTLYLYSYVGICQAEIFPAFAIGQKRTIWDGF